MADRREDQVDEEVAEDPMAEQEVADEEGEGEDLFGDNMMNDYAENAELDQYDPELVDDSEQPALDIRDRLEAERAMAERDRAAGRRRPPSSPSEAGNPPGTPAFRTRIAPGLEASPTGSSAGGSEPSEPGTARKRRRTSLGSTDAGDDLDPEDEDVPEHLYDLTQERLAEGVEIEKRLDSKIRLNFQQFLMKFTAEGQSVPKYPDMLRKMAEEHQAHLDVNFQHLQQWSAQLALWISDFPVQIMPILNETLMLEAARKFQTYQRLAEAGENELRVAVHSFPIKEPIRELCTRHISKLVHVTGVATKRSGVFNQVKRLWLRCAKCNFPSGPFEVAEDRDLRPNSCIECQSKGPWRVDRQRTIYQNYQKITLQESPSSVDPGKMPRSKEVILTGDQVDTVRPGDELDLTGIYRCLYDVATNARTCFPVYRTDLQSIHINRKGDLKLIQISDDQQQQILDLAKRPDIRERFITSMAPSIYGMWHVKTSIALSMMGGQQKIAAGKHRIRGDINTLVVGDPGLAKSQFLKYVEQTFPRAVYTTGKGASAVGLTAAVTRDEHGHFCLEGGAMVLADNGICLIDEFDKMNDQDRTSLHEAMEQQTISISKAGIVATLQARCAVVAVANPIEGRYDPMRTFSQNVNLSDPILSRFDMICVLRDESDPVQDELLADHVLCSHIRSHPDATAEEKNKKPKAQNKSHIQPIDQDLLKKYIVYARTRVFPKLTHVDSEKLASFYAEMRAEAYKAGGVAMTARHMDSLARLAEANARIELRNHVNSKDIDNAIAVMLESFIQSQKHQVAEELRKKFKRYIAQAAPLADQVMQVLEKLFKEKTIQLELSKPGQEVELDKVPVEMSELVTALDQADLDISEGTNFMQTPRFLQNFRVEDEKIYRVI
mmetsp:Transcript_45735/g.82325  ORF Transcript_45735/g.82325 Transcript_45735/m.82325 type:complete len:892 (+) Transcript_45735:64-2739(+)|eukprot:CAMPEP_0197658032 /NCGR_PEP_ID=MMETSP1338-20131121/44987_1 /TAXON_ID=43686 ORGANISM="Pelagodinium beii, Strain RCC1491" /NCGR_SAMPLE_ID=MMETSP1338 /ASSEMBLY_ACC=CAM_ASM_000754 /LENGTH=891 /DNA_ID=CAMNT_0043234529 /DNA_START=48 /DNA_END=2723 /DNA_ORIENTATION=+